MCGLEIASIKYPGWLLKYREKQMPNFVAPIILLLAASYAFYKKQQLKYWYREELLF